MNNEFKCVVVDTYSQQALHIRERALKKVSEVAYKDLIFNIKKEIRRGEFNRGPIIDNIYRAQIKIDPIIEAVYGKFEALYELDLDNKTYKMLRIEPEDFIMDVHKKILPVYRGIIYRDEKDKFKINIALCNRNRDN